MKTAISLPDTLFKEAEAAAKDLGLTRSKLIQTALEEFLQRRRDEEVAAAPQSLASGASRLRSILSCRSWPWRL